MRGLSDSGSPNTRTRFEVGGLVMIDSSKLTKYVAEHRISGEVLCLLDAEGLKEVGIATIGQRLSILKGVYNIKLGQGIPIESDHYVPPCECGFFPLRFNTHCSHS